MENKKFPVTFAYNSPRSSHGFPLAERNKINLREPEPKTELCPLQYITKTWKLALL